MATLAASFDTPVAGYRRLPYEYGTSHRLEEVEVVLEDGARLSLLLKHLRRSQLNEAARRAKPAFLHDPLREVEAYKLLASSGLGVPTLYASSDEWLLIEKIPGIELWQEGDVEVWAKAARWLRRLHERYTESPPHGRHLIGYDASYFGIWPGRAMRRHPQLTRVLGRYQRVVDLLSSLPTTMVHGEFYASNILVAGSRIAAVDWEMAGVGPGALDVAALLSGWSDEGRAVILSGYGAVSNETLDAARLHLALQWLGWSSQWTAPPEHAHDWLKEALSAAQRLDL